MDFLQSIGVTLIEIIITSLLALVSVLITFIGVRIFKHIDILTVAVTEFQQDIDRRINDFRRDFDIRCDAVYDRVNEHGERLARLETINDMQQRGGIE